MSSDQLARRLRFCWLLGSLIAVPGVSFAAEPGAAVSAQPAVVSAHTDIFGTVNGTPISVREYESAFAQLVRQKYYHGEVSEERLQEAREETKNKLVERILLLEEVQRRHIAPDQQAIDEAIAGYDRQYANSSVWKERRESLLPGLVKQLGEQSQLSLLEETVRHVPEPSEAEVRAFYDKQPQLFTEPEKLRVSIILLAVDPSSTSDVWKSTRVEAEDIYKRLMAGGAFEEAARLHSNGKFANEGGDMGYLHLGMLPLALQEKIDSYELGKINPPIDTLEGVAIFRLNDRLPAKKRDFADVASRAKELLIRERQEEAWKNLRDKLVASANIKIHSQTDTRQQEGNGS